MLLLEELSIRSGCVKPRFLKVLRMVTFWLGEEYARHIIDRLVAGGYVKKSEGRLCLAKEYPRRRSLSSLLREAEQFIKQLFLNRY